MALRLILSDVFKMYIGFSQISVHIKLKNEAWYAILLVKKKHEEKIRLSFCSAFLFYLVDSMSCINYIYHPVLFVLLSLQ